MSASTDPCAELRSVLRATAALCAQVDAETWTTAAARLASSTPGKQVRHLLDHVTALLDCLARPTPHDDARADLTVEYDRRERGGPVERSPEAARQAVERLLARISALVIHPDRPITVALQGEAGEVRAPSTVGRELLFVVHHARHHHAILRLSLDGLDLGERFGVAPATPGR